MSKYESPIMPKPKVAPGVLSGAAVLAACLTVSACTVGPRFVAPQADAPATWRDASVRASDGSVTTAAQADPRWWRAYGDPVLDSLVDRALASNLDAEQTIYRIAQSRAQERAAAAGGLPSLKAKGAVTREKIGQAQLLATGAGFIPPGVSISNLINPIDLYEVDFDASWELDLFGKVRRSVEQARAQTQEQIESHNDAVVSLEAEVTRNYLQLRANQMLFAQAEASIDDQSKIVSLTRRQREQGVATDLDIDQASSRLTQLQGQAPQMQQAVEQAMNNLAVLLGKAPGALDAELSVVAPLPAAPASVAVSLPSALARHRPDIRKAEAHLHAATANVGVSIAQLYPEVSLSGETGQQALSAKGLSAWSSNFYHFGPSISLPIFEGGQLRANVRLAKAEQAEAALNYRQTVLKALQDVENDLVALRTDRLRQDRQAEAAATAAHQLELVTDQYQAGVQTLVKVLDARASLASAQQDAIRSRLQVALDIAALSKAIGGGWEMAAPS